MPNNTVTHTQYFDEVKCPFCNKREAVMMTIAVDDIYVRETGRDGLDNRNHAVDQKTKVVGVRFSHMCNGPKEEK